jgi:hypothetical protein
MAKKSKVKAAGQLVFAAAPPFHETTTEPSFNFSTQAFDEAFENFCIEFLQDDCILLTFLEITHASKVSAIVAEERFWYCP